MIWTNLDFEYELRYGRDWQAPKPVRAHMKRWRLLLRGLPGQGDASPWDEQTPALTACWGESWRALQAMRHPDPKARLEAVHKANDKRTIYRISPHDRLPEARILGSIEELEEALERLPHEWLLKHPLGVSGRERIMGRVGELEPRHERWAARLFEQGEELLFEPKVSIDHEYSFHFNILNSAEIEFLGHCELLTDTQGTHRGHIIRPSARQLGAPAYLLEQVHRLHSQTGYTGPVSSDGYRGRLGNEEIINHVSEFNARITFGRMALEITRALWPMNRPIAWWHPSHRERLDQSMLEAWPAGPDQSMKRGWYRLPEALDPGGQSGTALFLGSAEEPLTGSEVEALWHAL